MGASLSLAALAMPAYPSSFRQTVLDLHGDAGTAWLDSLPALLDEVARQWSLTLLAPFPNLSYNYVILVRRADNTPAVLKVGVPNRELLTEIEALQLYAGQGAARLYAADPDRGALLLEALSPGVTLAGLAAHDDAQATAIAADVMRRLWRPAPADHSFPTVGDWARGLTRLRAHFGGGVGPFPRRLVEQAESLFADLLASQAAPVLLHGDLHHANILSAGRAPWLAIDPKGVVGEPAYEVGALLRNPYPEVLTWPALPRVLAWRLDQLAAELGLDRRRLHGWSLAQAVLSGWWSYEDSGRYSDEWVRIAEALTC